MLGCSNGVLFRGGSEGEIRKRLSEGSCMIISIPSGLFIGTMVPVTVLIINKNKQERKGRVYL